MDELVINVTITVLIEVILDLSPLSDWNSLLRDRGHNNNNYYKWQLIIKNIIILRPTFLAIGALYVSLGWKTLIFPSSNT